MKKLIFLSILTFGISAVSFAQNYGWTDISANIPGTPDLSDVFFVSDNKGWITSSSHAEIYHTTDGGETFEVQSTQLTCNAIHMLNENAGYAGGASGFIYKTIDGGENWNFYGTMVATLADITFPPNGETGYACGINGNIWSIDSTGVTKMTSNVNGHLNSISFPINSEEGWVCGGDVIRHYKSNIWNGDQDYPSGGYNAIFMLDNLNGWIVGDGGIIAHTENGWNWSEQINPDTHTLYDVFFLNTNEGWAVGLGSQILHTANGGNNWTINIFGDIQLNAVHFTSTTNGYVVGNSKTLLKYGEILGTGNAIVETLQFDIFPNPTKNKFEIMSSEFATKNCTIKLHDLHGKTLLVKQIATGHEKVEIDVSNLSSGVYFCTLSTDKKNSTKKLIIE